MKKFANNQELSEYLVSLSSDLKGRGAEQLSKVVDFARGQAVGMSTEFLGESRVALRRVLEEENGILKDQERDKLLDALRQLDEALDRR
jgi:hypothetical protein